MLPKVSLGRHSGATLLKIESYRPIVGDELVDEVLAVARKLKPIRICHLNSTAFGGGVAELLSRTVPLMAALGLEVDWRLIHANPEFFGVTKAFHNALQGAPHTLNYDELDLYYEVNRASADLLESEYDVIIVHDPQPAAVRHFSEARAKWIWRCHIDSSAPNLEVAGFLRPLVEEYDALVFTLPEFLLPDLAAKRVKFIAPAIDPLATKNVELPLYLCKSIREGFGLVVSEALWKEKPVVAGKAGGIPMQFPSPYGDYLVTSVEACAARTIELLRKPGARADFGRAGHEHVRRNFLLPRLVRDELRLIEEVVEQS